MAVIDGPWAKRVTEFEVHMPYTAGDRRIQRCGYMKKAPAFGPGSTQSPAGKRDNHPIWAPGELSASLRYLTQLHDAHWAGHSYPNDIGTEELRTWR